MSKLVQYVGILHVMKDHIKETWTQFWANLPNSSVNCGGDGGDSHDEKDINFRSRIKDKLNMLKQQSIRAIDSSSSDQEDYSHLTRYPSLNFLPIITNAVEYYRHICAVQCRFNYIFHLILLGLKLARNLCKYPQR